MPRTNVTGGQVADGSIDLGVDIGGTLQAGNGGTGRTTLPNGAVLLGAGTAAVGSVAPGGARRLLRSDGTQWASALLTPNDVQSQLTHMFTDDTDTASLAGGAADAGQAWAVYTTGTNPPRVSRAADNSGEGRYTWADTTGTNTSVFLGAQPNAAAIVNYLEADFNFAAGGTTDTQSVTLALTEQTIATSYGNSAINSPCWVTFGSGGYQVAVYNASMTRIVMQSIWYDTAFTTQNQHVEVFLDRVRGELHVRGPDGSVNTFSHAVMATMQPSNANWVINYAAAATDRRVEFSRVAADARPITTQSAVTTRGEQLVRAAQAATRRPSPWVSSLASRLTASNTTAQTEILTGSLAGRTLRAGSTFLITVAGSLSMTASGPTCTFRAFFGATAAAQTFVWTPGAAANGLPFELRIYVTVRSAGAAGTFAASGTGMVMAGNSTVQVLGGSTASTAAVDTTVAQTLRVTAAFSAAAAGNGIAVDAATIQQIAA